MQKGRRPKKKTFHNFDTHPNSMEIAKKIWECPTKFRCISDILDHSEGKKKNGNVFYNFPNSNSVLCSTDGQLTVFFFYEEAAS